MAYPIPENVSTVSGLKWYLVAIPDDVAYRRAAYNAYTELADVWNWGEDGKSPDAPQIRQQWLSAINATWELIEMGFPESLLDYIDEIEILLRELKAIGGCCPENITYLPGPTVGNPDGYAYDGDHPTTWGESTDTTDVADYNDVVCGAAHNYVDYLASTGVTLDALVQNKLLVVAAIASLLGALATGGLTLLVNVALAGGIFTALVSGWTSDLLTDAADAIESARSSILCAILSGDGEAVSDAIEAVVSASAFNLWFRWIDYQSAINVMLTGELSGEYLEPRLGETCGPCLDPEEASVYYINSAGMRDFDTGVLTNGQNLIWNHIYKVKGDTAGRLWAQMKRPDINGQRYNEIKFHVLEINRGDAGDGCADTYGLQVKDKDDTPLLQVLAANAEAYSGDTDQANRIEATCMGAFAESSDFGFMRFYCTPAT